MVGRYGPPVLATVVVYPGTATVQRTLVATQHLLTWRVPDDRLALAATITGLANAVGGVTTTVGDTSMSVADLSTPSAR